MITFHMIAWGADDATPVVWESSRPWEIVTVPDMATAVARVLDAFSTSGISAADAVDMIATGWVEA